MLWPTPFALPPVLVGPFALVHTNVSRVAYRTILRASQCTPLRVDHRKPLRVTGCHVHSRELVPPPFALGTARSFAFCLVLRACMCLRVPLR